MHVLLGTNTILKLIQYLNEHAWLVEVQWVFFIIIFFLQTLCNACGLQYLKMVKGTGSGLPAAVSDEGDASVPAETVERDSNL